MASKPTVTLTLAGDESKLTQAFDRVGEASEQMADKVTRSGKEMDDAGSSLDSLGESTDDAEGKFQGFADTLTGTQDIMTGFREGDIVGMATGFADLAGGLTEFVVPALASFASFLGGPLRAAMSFIAAHPLLIFFGLLTAAVIFLITQTEWFRNVATAVFEWVGNLVRNVFGAAVNWVVDRWNGLVSWFQGLPGRIGQALGALGGFFQSAFKGAANLAIDAVNWMIDRINGLIRGINHINPFEDIPSIPKLSRMHGGGVVPGMIGSEQLIIAQAGERLTPRGQDGNGGVALVVSGGADSKVAELINYLIRTGEIQAVPA